MRRLVANGVAVQRAGKADLWETLQKCTVQAIRTSPRDPVTTGRDGNCPPKGEHELSW